MVCRNGRIRNDQLHGTCDIETSTHNIKKNFTQHPYGVSHTCVEHGGLYIYIIMKTMCSPSSHRNVFVAIYSLGHMMYSYTLLVPMNQKELNKLSKLIYSYNRIVKSKWCPQGLYSLDFVESYP